jgi:hypothetical protein
MDPFLSSIEAATEEEVTHPIDRDRAMAAAHVEGERKGRLK